MDAKYVVRVRFKSGDGEWRDRMPPMFTQDAAFLHRDQLALKYPGSEYRVVRRVDQLLDSHGEWV